MNQKDLCSLSEDDKVKSITSICLFFQMNDADVDEALDQLADEESRMAAELEAPDAFYQIMENDSYDNNDRGSEYETDSEEGADAAGLSAD